MYVKGPWNRVNAVVYRPTVSKQSEKAKQNEKAKQSDMADKNSCTPKPSWFSRITKRAFLNV